GRQRGGARAEAPDHPTVGQGPPQGGRKGDPRVRSGTHALHRRQPHPYPAPPAQRRAAARAGEGRAQVRRRGPGGGAPRAYRGDQQDQENRARLRGRKEAHRKGRSEGARRSSATGGRSGEGEGSGDHGDLRWRTTCSLRFASTGPCPATWPSSWTATVAGRGSAACPGRWAIGRG